MEIKLTKPIDIIYLYELQEIAKWYEEDIDFALKQCIALHHSKITNNKKTG